MKTATSRKPIAEWVILGLSYIDDQALEGIRRKCGYYREEAPTPPTPSLEDKLREVETRLSRLESLLGLAEPVLPLSHECVEYMLIETGRRLGFKVYTADSSKTCSGVRLGNVADMSKEDLRARVGPALLDPLSRIDVVWFKPEVGTYYAFEVVTTTSIRDALIRLHKISELRAHLYVVAGEDRRREFEREVSSITFRSIKDRCKFLSFTEVTRIYTLTKLWTQAVSELHLPLMM